MRKGLAFLFIIAALAITVCLMPQKAEAADDYFWPLTGSNRDSTFIQKDQFGWAIFKHDTCTINACDADTTIDLGTTYYNFIIYSLNGAGDSGSVKVSFYDKGIWHNDSVAENLNWIAVGLNSGADKLIAPIGSRYIDLRGVVGGTADSLCTLDIWCVR